MKTTHPSDTRTPASLDERPSLAGRPCRSGCRHTVEQAFDRLSEHITRVAVRRADQDRNNSAGQGGQNDHRCMLQARLDGRQPVAVTAHDATQEQAVQGAVQKLAHWLDSTPGRLHAHWGRHGERTSDPTMPGTEPAPR